MKDGSESYAWMQPTPGALIFNVTWIIIAPWAHPIWSQYALLLYDLTSPSRAGPPTIHMPGATHEFMLFALDPAAPVARDSSIRDASLRLLQPPNHGYQLYAASDDDAVARIQQVVDRIVAGNMSPDTDFRWEWDELFPDAFSLVMR